MDVRAVRLQIVAERERQGLNQRELAAKAGLDQGHMSKIENVDGEAMRDLAARIVFQVVERGLGVPLSAFFARIEGVSAPASTQARADRLPSIAPSDRDKETVIQTLAELLARASERADAAHSRQITDPREASAERAPARRTSTRRPAKRRQAGRRVKR